MWLLKGILGFALFMGGLLLSVLVGIARAVARGAVQSGHATGLSAIFAVTIWNPWFYTALLGCGCVLIGVALMGNRSTPNP